MIFIMRCEKCNHLNGNVNGEVVRSNAVCECSCHDIPTDEAAQHQVQLTASGATPNDEHLADYNYIRECYGLPKLGGN